MKETWNWIVSKLFLDGNALKLSPNIFFSQTNLSHKQERKRRDAVVLRQAKSGTAEVFFILRRAAVSLLYH